MDDDPGRRAAAEMVEVVDDRWVVVERPATRAEMRAGNLRRGSPPSPLVASG
jgi:hypothetical protein